MRLRFEEALAASKVALDLRRQLHGEGSIPVAEAYYATGFAAGFCADFESGIKYYLRSLDIRRRKCGEAHNSVTDLYRYLSK